MDYAKLCIIISQSFLDKPLPSDWEGLCDHDLTVFLETWVNDSFEYIDTDTLMETIEEIASNINHERSKQCQPTNENIEPNEPEQSTV